MSPHENSTHTATDPTGSPPRLPAALRLGAVHLTVSDLDRSVAFYEEPEARRPGRHAGLYHYALLFPSREELAHAALRLAATRTPIQGASDHGTHEAIYLPAPEDRVGLRHWTVVLDDPEEIETVRERVEATGIATEEREDGGAGGFLVRDPWGIAMLFVTPEDVAA